MGKNPRPYRGIVFTIFFMMLFPALCYLLIYVIFKSYNDVPESVIIDICFALAGLIATLFNGICILTGLFKGLIGPMIERIKDLFEDLSLKTKGAFKNYIASFYIDGGILLWFFILWMIFCLVASIIGFVHLVDWFQTLENWRVVG